MALHWNIEACSNTEALKADNRDGWPVTDCTIWLCMIVGIDTITEQNAEAFWHRVYAYEQALGPVNSNGRRMEPRDIAARIGLRTNASRMTDAKWRGHLADLLKRDSAAKWSRTSAGMEWLKPEDHQTPDTAEADKVK